MVELHPLHHPNATLASLFEPQIPSYSLFEKLLRENLPTVASNCSLLYLLVE